MPVDLLQSSQQCMKDFHFKLNGPDRRGNLTMIDFRATCLLVWNLRVSSASCGRTFWFSCRCCPGVLEEEGEAAADIHQQCWPTSVPNRLCRHLCRERSWNQGNFTESLTLTNPFLTFKKSIACQPCLPGPDLSVDMSVLSCGGVIFWYIIYRKISRRNFSMVASASSIIPLASSSSSSSLSDP